MPSVTLSDRAFLTVSGKDAEDFLQALITTDLPSLPESETRPGALLTPQGKILFYFQISRDGAGGFLIETEESQRDALAKRLTMYKLRAAVDIAMRSETQTAVAWGEDAERLEGAARDLRFVKAGTALHRRPGEGGSDPAAAYDALRIASAVLESGADFALSDVFPHDVLLDLSGGLSFRKGCYVGQEVVSRMQHRGTARRRPAIVNGDAALPACGTEIVAGGKPVGTLGTAVGASGLAILRLDRAAEAIRGGTPMTAGDVTVTIALPEWTGLAFPEDSGEVSA
ncbi:MAG: folate-binding protein YgfZ [Shinella sp.]|nr:folate-binding protein YgfZ [Shinella sp.]